MAEKKISGVVYRFDELTGWDAFEALQLLIKVAGPFMPLLEAVAIDDEKERAVKLAGVLPSILGHHDAAALRQLLDMLVASIRADGSEAIVGVKPQSLDEMFQVFAWALGVQFGRFFEGEGVSAILAAAARKI